MQFSVINYSHHAVHYFPMTYLFYNWKCALLTPFTHFPYHPPPPPSSVSSNHQSVLCIYELYFFFFKIPHISEIIWYLSFSDLFPLAC